MKPIIFNTEMVRAILDGRKTATRRVIKLQPTYSRWNCIGWLGWDDGHGCKMRQPYREGDILYVRESWHETPAFGVMRRADWGDGACPYMEPDDKWLSPACMPREIARIFLRVTNVSVARLQDITEDEILKEGLSREPMDLYIDSKYLKGTEQYG